MNFIGCASPIDPPEMGFLDEVAALSSQSPSKVIEFLGENPVWMNEHKDGVVYCAILLDKTILGPHQLTDAVWEKYAILFRDHIGFVSNHPIRLNLTIQTSRKQTKSDSPLPIFPEKQTKIIPRNHFFAISKKFREIVHSQTDYLTTYGISLPISVYNEKNVYPFVRFLDTGTVVIDQENAIDLFLLAHEYEIPNLKSKCLEFIRCHWNIGTRLCTILRYRDRDRDRLVQNKKMLLPHLYKDDLKPILKFTSATYFSMLNCC